MKPPTQKQSYDSASRSALRTSRLPVCLTVASLAAWLVLGLVVAVPRARAADPYAKAVVYANILNGNIGNSSPNSTNALGAPDGVSVCMGGPGASLILDMGADTPVTDGPGPDLAVLERGAAYGGEDESYNVLVSNSPDTNTFVFVGQGRALSLLDIHAAGLGSARYVWLQDLATETLNTSSPGADIDSVRGLYGAGSSNDIAPPTAAQVRLTGQGAWLSWQPSTATNLTGYAVRRSLDGVAFGSSADVVVGAEQTAWHDVTLPVVGPFFYAVSAVAGSKESVPVLVGVPGCELALLTNRAMHLGDDTVAAWEVPTPQRECTLTFTLPALAEGPQGELTLEAFDVDNSVNAVLLNGAKVATLPAQAAESWMPKTLRFAAGALQPGLNTLTFSARDSSGGLSGSLDDFQLRNVRLRLYGAQASLELLTHTCITQLEAGQSQVVLRWVVEQTPTLSPAAWQTVSSPIEWTGTLQATNGFFRLRDAP